MTLTLENSTISKSYYFNTTPLITLTKDFGLIVLPLPGGSSDQTIVSSKLGVTNKISVSFEITPRPVGSQKYDGTTVATTPTSIFDEAKYLYETIAETSGDRYKLTYSLWGYWDAAIENMTIPITGDQPNKLICNINFIEKFKNID